MMSRLQIAQAGRLAVVAVMTLWTAAPRAEYVQSPSIKDVLALEQSWVDGLIRRDLSVFERILDDSLTVIGPEGQMGDKQTFLTFFKTDGWQYLEAVLEGVNVRIQGDTALVTGRLKRSIRLGDRTFQGTLWFTHVWVRKGGAWRVIHSHQSTLPTPSPSAARAHGAAARQGQPEP